MEKRLPALKAAQGDLPGAIKEMNEYLRTYMGDSEAWCELLHLHLEAGRLSSAKFCAEELILFNPHNYAFALRYAEVLYTLGGAENLLLARKYYGRSVELNPTCARALFGLALVGRIPAAPTRPHSCATRPPRAQRMSLVPSDTTAGPIFSKELCQSTLGPLYSLPTPQPTGLETQEPATYPFAASGIGPPRRGGRR